jgi:hypothetical protein
VTRPLAKNVELLEQVLYKPGEALRALDSFRSWE